MKLLNINVQYLNVSIPILMPIPVLKVFISIASRGLPTIAVEVDVKVNRESVSRISEMYVQDVSSSVMSVSTRSK